MYFSNCGWWIVFLFSSVKSTQFAQVVLKIINISNRLRNCIIAYLSNLYIINKCLHFTSSFNQEWLYNFRIWSIYDVADQKIPLLLDYWPIAFIRRVWLCRDFINGTKFSLFPIIFMICCTLQTQPEVQAPLFASFWCLEILLTLMF